MSVSAEVVLAILATCLLFSGVQGSRFRSVNIHVDLAKSTTDTRRSKVISAALDAELDDDAHDDLDLAKFASNTHLSSEISAALDAVLENGEQDHQTVAHLAKEGAKLLHADMVAKSIPLPSEVSKLVSHMSHSNKAGSGSSSGLALDPSAVDKAVIKLNDMVMKAMTKLDEKTVECWEFKGRNLGSWKQVVTDL